MVTQEQGVEMTPELIKILIHTATSRDQGLAIKVEMPAGVGKKAKGVMTFKDTKPGVVKFLNETRIGLHIDGISVVSATEASGRNFLRWLEIANQLAPKGEDYGHPEECPFRRCS